MFSMTLMIAAIAMAPTASDQPPPVKVGDLINAIKTRDQDALDELTGGIVGYDIYSRKPQKVGAGQMMADLKACRHVKTEEWEPQLWMTTWLCDAGMTRNEYCKVPAYGVQMSWRFGPHVTAYFREDLPTDQPCKGIIPSPPPRRALPAEYSPPAPAIAKQLADAVTSGAVLVGSTYTSFFSESQINWLAGLKGCPSTIKTAAIPGVPMTAIVLWQCPDRKPGSTAVMLTIEKDRIVRATPLGDLAKAR